MYDTLLTELHLSSIQANKPDSWEWRHDNSKTYFVKSAYKLLSQRHQQQSLLAKHSHLLWRSRAPLKVITFCWRLFQDRIPSKDALFRRGVSLTNGGEISCSFCNEESESSAHLFSYCHLTYTVWQFFYNWLNISVALHSSPFHNFLYHMGMVKDKKCWPLWNMIWFAIIWTT
ncbi:putative reverse transcriptase zinc-binding domain-containing protein [Lupinus albus]|uniref:Putative reverse transcriptase zinc-binding domain-containing protein n=1 Tax=Lupinus albus TaxID=3870 RepID=A0A6A4NI66_LUPAL|nr:putative reverse transcriptase zinc-binding domain-containing protein [Lupinus albus]